MAEKKKAVSNELLEKEIEKLKIDVRKLAEKCYNPDKLEINKESK